MAAKSKSATQIYFNKDHDMVRKAVREFVDKEINPFMDEMLISRCYRDARLIAIGGGADEIMREIIAKMVLG